MSESQKVATIYTREPFPEENWRKVAEDPFRLNLGCGDRFWDGFVNVDLKIKPQRGHMYRSSDISKLDWLEDNFVDEIHAIHCVEHLKRRYAWVALKEWYRVLNDGGLLVLELPCLDKILKCLTEGNRQVVLNDGRQVSTHVDAMAGLYGDQVSPDPAMDHKWCYTEGEIRTMLAAANFKNIDVKEPLYHRPFRDMRVEAKK